MFDAHVQEIAAVPPSRSTPRRVRLFRDNRNQVIRIPVEFELPGSEVFVSRDGDRLIIEPVRKRSLAALLDSWVPLVEEFPEIDDPAPRPQDVF
jgi:antitoxin VapB